MALTLEGARVCVEDAAAKGGREAWSSTSLVLGISLLGIRMEFPLVVGGGQHKGKPEGTQIYSPPEHTTIRATPWQLAVLTAVWNYNIGLEPDFVNPLPELPPTARVLHVKLTLPLVTLRLVSAATMAPVAELHLHRFTCASIASRSPVCA